MYKVTYANFGIEKKRTDKTGVISALLIWSCDQYNTMNPLGWYTRDAIIQHIKSGQTYMTISITTNGWSMGAEIHVVRTKDGEYLRTDTNQISGDNLVNLPEG